MCDVLDTTLERRLKAKDVTIADLCSALEAAIHSMERMDALLLQKVAWGVNVEKGDITRAKEALAKAKGG